MITEKYACRQCGYLFEESGDTKWAARERIRKKVNVHVCAVPDTPARDQLFALLNMVAKLKPKPNGKA